MHFLFASKTVCQNLKSLTKQNKEANLISFGDFTDRPNTTTLCGLGTRTDVTKTKFAEISTTWQRSKQKQTALDYGKVKHCYLIRSGEKTMPLLQHMGFPSISAVHIRDHLGPHIRDHLGPMLLKTDLRHKATVHWKYSNAVSKDKPNQNIRTDTIQWDNFLSVLETNKLVISVYSRSQFPDTWYYKALLLWLVQKLFKICIQRTYASRTYSPSHLFPHP